MRVAAAVLLVALVAGCVQEGQPVSGQCEGRRARFYTDGAHGMAAALAKQPSTDLFRTGHATPPPAYNVTGIPWPAGWEGATVTGLRLEYEVSEYPVPVVYVAEGDAGEYRLALEDAGSPSTMTAAQWQNLVAEALMTFGGWNSTAATGMAASAPMPVPYDDTPRAPISAPAPASPALRWSATLAGPIDLSDSPFNRSGAWEVIGEAGIRNVRVGTYVMSVALPSETLAWDDGTMHVFLNADYAGYARVLVERPTDVHYGGTMFSAFPEDWRALNVTLAAAGWTAPLTWRPVTDRGNIGFEGDGISWHPC